MSETPPITSALVADPSSHMAGIVALMLQSLKIRPVDQVSDLRRTAAALAQHPYGLVLIDEQLGGDEGFAMIRVIRQSPDHPNRLVPIIMMASAPDARMIAAARDAGVTEFLRKPFSAHHIELRLETIRKSPRNFVETKSYTGPDRRRRNAEGPKRRASDGKKSA